MEIDILKEYAALEAMETKELIQVSPHSWIGSSSLSTGRAS